MPISKKKVFSLLTKRVVSNSWNKAIILSCFTLFCLFSGGCHDKKHIPLSKYRLEMEEGGYVWNVKDVDILNFNAENTQSLDILKTSPKEALINWAREKIHPVGETGALNIIVENAFLRSVPEPKEPSAKRYHARYDVKFYLVPIVGDKKNENIELSIHVENFRLIKGAITFAERQGVLTEQVQELISLLENELRKQANICFHSYLTVL